MRWLALVASLVAPAAALGETPAVDPIDAALTACLAAEVNQTTVGMITCTQTATRQWDAELNRVYGALMAKLDAPRKEQLKAAQRAWIAFRDADIVLLVDVPEPAGSLYRLAAASSEMELTRSRAIELRSRLSLL